MSVQLEILPQNYSGFAATYYPFGNEMVADGETFLSSTFNGNGDNNTTVFASSIASGPLSTIQTGLQNLVIDFTNLNTYIGAGEWMTAMNTASTGVTPGSGAFPVGGGQQLYFKGPDSGNNDPNMTCVMQRLDGITIGLDYTITLKVGDVASAAVPANNKIWFGMMAGNAQVFNNTLGMSGGPLPTTPITWLQNPISPLVANQTYTTQFTAQSENDIVVVAVQLDSDSTIGIDQVSVIYSYGGEIESVFSGAVICDLYEDEDIPLTLSIDDFKNVAEKVQSYSKAFNLPSTKRNSQIFDNIFEVTRSAHNNISFNPYIKTQCRLKEDGFVLFEGYLRLIDVQDKNGEISYNVNLYSEAIALADILKERTFADLDFNELAHNYTITDIAASWGVSGITYTNAATSGYRDADTLKYPFVDWEHNYTIYTTGGVDYPRVNTLQSTFRPFIQLSYLIKQIFNQPAFPFEYTSDFFDTDDFKNLYMDFNWGDGTVPLTFDNSGGLSMRIGFSLTGSYQTIISQELSDASWILLNPGTTLNSNIGYDDSTGVFTAVADNQTYNITYNFLMSGGTVLHQYSAKWVHTDASGNENPLGEVIGQLAFYPYSGSFAVTLQTGETLELKAKEDVGSITVYQNWTGIPTANIYYLNTVTVSSNATSGTSASLLQTLRGELNQWDFLKGLVTMFNLIMIPDKSNPSNLLIEPYADVFVKNTSGLTLSARSIAHDWTEKISLEQMKLSPLSNLNQNTIFKFVEDDDDYAFKIYKDSVQGHLYGSKLYDASGFTILEGEKEIVAEPFAATVCKALMTQFPSLITPSIYSYDPSDGTSSSFDNSPRIMYNNGTVYDTYRVSAQNGVAATTKYEYLLFSHLKVVAPAPTPRDFHFGECQLFPGVGSSPTDNLFNTYWLPYFGELYHSDTRTMTIKVDLKASDITTFNMYDTVFVKNRQFRVNKIDYKPGDLSTVEFILIP